MGDFGGLSCTKSARKPEYSPILTPGGRSARCQGHRGLNDQPAAEAGTFAVGMWCWDTPDPPRNSYPPRFWKRGAAPVRSRIREPMDRDAPHPRREGSAERPAAI
jgi:hypothetical protein